MSRNKTKQAVKSKVKNTTNKRQSKWKGLSLIETMEKDFNAIPAKLIALCKKESILLKQQEKKLKIKLNKAKTQKKAIKAKKTAWTGKSTTAATKQSTIQLNNLINELSTEIEQINKWWKALIQKQAKLNLIKKQISQAEKEIKKNVKQPTKLAKKTKAPKATSVTQAPQAPIAQTKPIAPKKIKAKSKPTPTPVANDIVQIPQESQHDVLIPELTEVES